MVRPLWFDRLTMSGLGDSDSLAMTDGGKEGEATHRHLEMLRPDESGLQHDRHD